MATFRFLKILKIHEFFYKIREIFVCFCFICVHKDDMFTIKIANGAKRPISLVLDSLLVSLFVLFVSNKHQNG